ncbi:hypothetical protein [uncultured Imperialibacter sp.]|uniref:hypothetical protein n=1 Tax=uncultured Imperialibacter sp. TaxID=1672639 RepID=UPI0030DC5D70|tara:strand:- start:1352 stop:1909 length:558 start_codon:yes stop_codon:yes gene_type:complete
MRYLAILFFMISYSVESWGQVKVFTSHDTKMTLYRGDTVAIEADTASLLSSSVIYQINELTYKYEALLQRYNTNIGVNKRLLAQLTTTKESLEKLLDNNTEGNVQIGALNEVVARLTTLSVSLNDTNKNLEANTTDLDAMIQELKEQNRELKRQINRMGLDKFKDRLLFGTIGAAILSVVWLVAG